MNKLTSNKKRTFRFPFDIDRRIFLVLSVIFFIFSIKSINQLLFPRLSSKSIAKNIDRSFQKELKDFNSTVNDLQVKDFEFDKSELKKFEAFGKKNWSFFITHDDSLLFWSKSENYLKGFDLAVKDSLYSYQYNGEIGVFIKKEKKINNTSYNVIGKFPLYIEYKIKNNLLHSFFTYSLNQAPGADDFGYRLITKTDATKQENKIVTLNGLPRFELIEKNSFLDLTDKNFWHFFFAALPFIFFGISIHTYFKVSVRNKPALYFSLLILTVLIIRTLGYTLGFPDSFSEFQLFNPSIYGAGYLNISLGDVFINACLIFWVLFFFIMNVQNRIFNIHKKWHQVVFIAGYAAVLFYFMTLCILIIKSIVFDSTLNFNTTNYNNINSLTLVGLGTMLITFMNYVLGVIILQRYFDRYFPANKLKYLPTLVCLLLSYIFVGSDSVEIITISCLWTLLLLYFLGLKFLVTKFDFNSYKLIYWLIFLSISCVMMVYFFEVKKEKNLRKEYAASLMRFENKNTENELVKLGQALKNDSFISEAQSKSTLAEHLNHNYLYIFESEYVAKLSILKKADTATNRYKKLRFSRNVKIISPSNPTIYLKNEIGDEAYHFEDSIGQWVINLKLYPALSLEENNELTKDLELSQEKEVPLYQYAYYNNGKLSAQSGICSFPEKLPVAILRHSGEVNLPNSAGFSDIIAHGINGPENKAVIIRKLNNTAYEISTNYAYVFTIIFLIISLYILGNIIARSNLRRKRFINLLGLTLRMRIHLSILFVELISLLIIGFFTILILSNDTQKTNLHRATLASNEIRQIIEEKEINSIALLNLDQEKNANSLMATLNPYLEKHEVGLNIYSLQGNKLFSTVSKKISGLLPHLMNPKAFTELKRQGKISSLQMEKIGNLDYFTIYSNLKNIEDKNIGILEVANFSSQQMIQKNNAKIVTMLINIYAFVFLLSSLFAFYITKRLTNSFSKIVTQFSKINLTEVNQPLKWPYSDEIGLLIKEYNRTLLKLENSTAMLAKSERETAWREMARQIAHEIKNPLTPMSLSLQSLQVAIKRNDPKVPELTQKMTTTVLEQINVLTRTASNFSEFATMTDIVARKESLIDILESTTGIYSDSVDAEFLFVLPKKDIPLFVDKVKIIRVLTNIIQNALQAIPEEVTGQIMMTVTKQDKNQIDITIADNGSGIPEEIGRKIFEPNFTTKSSGSGLGLAMCMDIMLKSGGSIYYNTVAGEGSTFHVILPIYSEE